MQTLNVSSKQAELEISKQKIALQELELIQNTVYLNHFAQ